MLTKADSPSYHSRPADHHLDNLLHSLAMIIARDKSHEYSLSTRKLILTSEGGFCSRTLSSRVVLQKARFTSTKFRSKKAS